MGSRMIKRASRYIPSMVKAICVHSLPRVMTCNDQDGLKLVTKQTTFDQWMKRRKEMLLLVLFCCLLMFFSETRVWNLKKFRRSLWRSLFFANDPGETQKVQKLFPTGLGPNRTGSQQDCVMFTYQFSSHFWDGILQHGETLHLLVISLFGPPIFSQNKFYESGGVVAHILFNQWCLGEFGSKSIKNPKIEDA